MTPQMSEQILQRNELEGGVEVTQGNDSGKLWAVAEEVAEGRRIKEVAEEVAEEGRRSGRRRIKGQIRQMNRGD